ncbi:unnamed protein product [Somion occarium]|uniref:Uncharacterized protein n=1 Tax=Somion occarium TaxID=3059160 RepID=A0ABP1D734_9APHY
MAASPLPRSTSSTQVLTESPIAGNLRIHASSPALKRKRSLLSNKRTATPSLPSFPSQPPYHFNLSDMLSSPVPEIPEIPPCPPSPVPTEIIELEPSPDVDHVDACVENGIKVRDFAYENLPDSCVIAHVWRNPINILAIHDRGIRRPSRHARYRLDGMNLYRLLESGWVTEKEAKMYWQKADWEAMEQYKARPGRAQVLLMSPEREKPTKRYRLLVMKANEDPDREIPDSEIWMPDDEPGMWDGEGDTVIGKKLPEPLRPVHADPQDAHIAKKRKLDTGAEPSSLDTEIVPGAANEGDGEKAMEIDTDEPLEIPQRPLSPCGSEAELDISQDSNYHIRTFYYNEGLEDSTPPATPIIPDAPLHRSAVSSQVSMLPQPQARWPPLSQPPHRRIGRQATVILT